MTRTLVTGGAGFIGAHVVDELVALGHAVVVLDDLSGGFAENVNPEAEFVQGSILDHDLVNRLFARHRFDFVFHLAAYAAEGLSHFIKRFNYQNNLIGSVNLINAAVNSGSVKCFVFTSSIAVYGRNQLPMTEDLVPMPDDPYGIAKYAVELDLKETLAMFRMPSIVFRPHNVFGPRQNLGDRYRNVVGIFMNQAMRGEPFTIFGDGTQTRAFTYIGDITPIIARSCEREQAYNQVFNIGGDHPCTVNELAAATARAMAVPLRVEHLPARTEVQHAYSSHERIRAAFPELIAETALEDGLDRMARWARQHGSRASKVFTDIEIARNLPASWARAAHFTQP